MAAFHVPVLVDAVCQAFTAPLSRPGPRTFVDATCGGGGHRRAIAERFGPLRVLGLDRDPAALAATRATLADIRCDLELVGGSFSALDEVCDQAGIERVDALLADLGVSSHQLDSAERGFSFQRDAVLDMRMDPSRSPSAAELLATIDVDALTRILREYGEEPLARRVAESIVRRRPARTGALVDAVVDALGKRRVAVSRTHPATRTFQAIRIAVNAELDELASLLRSGPARLREGGRMAVITFHSLEDRMVKRRFTELGQAPELPRGLPVTAREVPAAAFLVPHEFRGGVTAGDEELASNPRARSARLRVIERAAA